MPTPSEEIDDILKDEAAAPASSSSDGNSATGRSLSELIAASKYFAAKAAQTDTSGRPRSGWSALGRAKIQTPGAAD